MLRQGSNARDSSYPTARSSPVILSEAKDLAAAHDRPFASLRVTRGDCSNWQGQFVQIEPCLILQSEVVKMVMISPLRIIRRFPMFIIEDY